jgi:hypothetical protein
MHIYRIRNMSKEISSPTSSSADSFLRYFCYEASISAYLLYFSDRRVSSVRLCYRPVQPWAPGYFCFQILFIDVSQGFYLRFHKKTLRLDRKCYSRKHSSRYTGLSDYYAANMPVKTSRPRTCSAYGGLPQLHAMSML